MKSDSERVSMIDYPLLKDQLHTQERNLPEKRDFFFLAMLPENEPFTVLSN